MLAKARLVEIKWGDNQTKPEDVPGGRAVTVQFNPQTLRITYANQNAGGDQAGSRKVTQFVGSGTSKLAVELLFDTSETGEDVRKRVEDVAFFMKVKDTKTRVPPGTRFEWGSFIFRGVVDALGETLEYFSETGVPLRAVVTLNISRQDIEFEYGKAADEGGAAGAAPTQPLETARSDDSMQSLAGRSGRSGDWKAIAAANDIDDPMRLPPGTLVDVNRRGGS